VEGTVKAKHATEQIGAAAPIKKRLAGHSPERQYLAISSRLARPKSERYCCGGRRRRSSLGFVELHARDRIALEDPTSIAAVSTRALKRGFPRFRNKTPRGSLRTVRLEFARAELVREGQRMRSVTAIANAFEFGHPGRFARDHKARFATLADASPQRRRTMALKFTARAANEWGHS